jgi:hypothetical protein
MRDRCGAFWEIAAPYLASGACDEGTIMGHACLRAKGEFVAMHWGKGGGMVVKLDAAAAAERIAAGRGQPFAPAGRAFREWLTVPETAMEDWAETLAAAVRLAQARKK